MIFLVLRLKKRTRSPSFWSSQIEQSSASNTAGRKRNGFHLFALRHSDDRLIVSHIDRNTARQYLRCLLRYWRICATLSSWLPTATVAAENVIEIINLAVGTNRTVTQINKQVPLPTTTNSDGTVTRIVTYFLTGETYLTHV